MHVDDMKFVRLRNFNKALTHWRWATEISVLRQPGIGDGLRRFLCLRRGGWKRGLVLLCVRVCCYTKFVGVLEFISLSKKYFVYQTVIELSFFFLI